MRRTLRWLLWLVLLGLPAWAGEVPSHNQAVLMLRTLMYDRALPRRTTETVRVVVVAASPNDSGMAAVLQELASKAVVGGKRVVVDAVAPSQLARALERPCAAVYVEEGAGPLTPLVTATRAAKVLSFSSGRAASAAGVAVSFVVGQERAAVVVNRAAAALEGANFDAAFLALAEVR